MLADFNGASAGENVTQGEKHQNSSGQDEQEPKQPYIRGIQVSRRSIAGNAGPSREKLSILSVCGAICRTTL